jgi:hypothetical protein
MLDPDLDPDPHSADPQHCLSYPIAIPISHSKDEVLIKEWLHGCPHPSLLHSFGEENSNWSIAFILQ